MSAESRLKQSESLKLHHEIHGHPLLGHKCTRESILKRAATRRRRCLGNLTKHKSRNTYYWVVLTPVGQRYQHRVIMEQFLKRKLRRNEHVHHRDGDGLNNNINNLMVVPSAYHVRQHLLINTWSRKFKCCIECGTRKRKHLGQGLCSACWQREYQLKKHRL